MSHTIEPRKLKGFRDYSPEQALMRKFITDQVWQVAVAAGFQPIMTPALEYAETLVGSGGGDTDKEVYRFKDHGDREVALRFDLTVPFARFVAEHRGTLVFPFKKVQIGDVWRGEKPQKGRYREFCQADLDIVGVDSLAADVEVLSCLSAVLGSFDKMTFDVALGHRVLLSKVISRFLPSAAASESTILTLIDKLTKIGEDDVVSLIAKVPGASDAEARVLVRAITRRDAQGETDLDALAEEVGGDEEFRAELLRFRETRSVLQTLHRPNVKFRADLSIARGLGYYTGIVFETTIDQLPGFGSIASGGRYNRLLSRFTSQELPGMGGSIGVDRFLAALEEVGQLALGTFPRDVYVAVATEDSRAYAVAIADDLRRTGVPCDLSIKPGKLGQQFKNADRLGYRLVILVGTEELQSQTFSIKILASGEEIKGLRRSDLIQATRAALA